VRARQEQETGGSCRLSRCLHILAELQTAFKDDAKLDICLPKCKLYIKGLTLGETQEEVHKAVEADPRLYSLKDILNNNVVQPRC